jgi:hypothetical protein
MRKLRKQAGYLMLIIGLIYLAQLWVLGIAPHVLIGALFGLGYLLTGLGLLGKSTPSLWLGCFLPLLCIAASAYRYLAIVSEPIILVNILINLPVLTLCVFLIYQTYIKNKLSS